MKLPDDMFNQEILQYLTLDNIVKLDFEGVDVHNLIHL
jgi:hypothetical protein